MDTCREGINGLGLDKRYEFDVEGVTGRGRPQLGWREQVDKKRVKPGYRMLRLVTGVNGDMGYLGFITNRQMITPNLGEVAV